MRGTCRQRYAGDTLPNPDPNPRASARTEAIVLAAILCFAAGLANHFIGDDRFLIGERLSPGRAGLPDLLFQDYRAGVFPSPLYRPAGLMLLYLERLMFGATPWPYHVVSLVMHAVNCLLVLRIWRRFIDFETAWLAAALFAVHPVHTEAVVPVYGQFDLLAALLVLLAVLRGVSVSALVLLLAAMLTKETAVAAPALVWLAAGERQQWWRRSDALLGLPWLPYFALRYAVVGSAEEGTGGVMAAVVRLAHAIRLLIFPTGQTIDYGHLRDSLSGIPLLELAWLAAGVWIALWILSRRHPLELTALAWFGFAIVPAAVFAGAFEERSLYLPSAGVVLLLARALSPAPRVVTSTVLVGAMLTSAMVSWNWRTEESVWRITVARHPRSEKANALLSLELLKKGDDRLLPEAERYARRALELNPQSPDALFATGWILAVRGDCAQALPLLRRARRIRPSDAGIGGLILACEGP